MKYHIDRNGKPARCTATIKACPCGGVSEHFDTIEQAQQAADTRNSQNFGMLGDLFGGKPQPPKQIFGDPENNIMVGYSNIAMLKHSLEHEFVFRENWESPDGNTHFFKGTKSEIEQDMKSRFSDKERAQLSCSYSQIKDPPLEHTQTAAAVNRILKKHPSGDPVELFNQYAVNSEEYYMLTEDDCKGKLIGGLTLNEALDREQFLKYSWPTKDGGTAVATRGERNEVMWDNPNIEFDAYGVADILPPDQQPKCIRAFAENMYNLQEKELFNIHELTNKSTYYHVWYRYGESNI
jgi:hypothetical protein